MSWRHAYEQPGVTEHPLSFAMTWYDESHRSLMNLVKTCSPLILCHTSSRELQNPPTNKQGGDSSVAERPVVERKINGSAQVSWWMLFCFSPSPSSQHTPPPIDTARTLHHQAHQLGAAVVSHCHHRRPRPNQATPHHLAQQKPGVVV